MSQLLAYTVHQIVAKEQETGSCHLGHLGLRQCPVIHGWGSLVSSISEGGNQSSNMILSMSVVVFLKKFISSKLFELKIFRKFYLKSEKNYLDIMIFNP